MKFNKKSIATVSALCLSGAMIAASGLAMSENLSSYNSFKEALISSAAGPVTNNSYNERNDSSRNFLSISKDGELILEGLSVVETANTKATYGKQHSYGLSTSSNGVQGNEFWYVSEGPETEYSISGDYGSGQYTKTTVTFSGEQLAFRREMERDSGKESSVSYVGPSEAEKKFVSAFIDLMAGDAKNYFYSNGESFGLRLEGAQIPEIAQLGLSAILSELSSKEDPQYPLAQTSTKEMDDLLLKEIGSLQDAKFEKIEVTVPSASNEIMENFLATATIVGYDQNGKKHNFSVHLETKKDKVGSTVIELPDDSTIISTKTESASGLG